MKQALALAVLAGSIGFSSASWADTYGNNGGTPLNVATSWIDETVPSNTTGIPGATDIAAWDSNDTVAASPFALGADTAWRGILIQSPVAAVTIDSGVSNLSLGSSGIDMTAATQDLTISALNTFIVASQVWNVANGRTLTLTGPVDRLQSPFGLNTGGSLQISTTGTIMYTGAGNQNKAYLSDAGGNAYATYGLSDWAATDATGKVIAATYTTTTPAGTANFDVTSNQTRGNGTTTDFGTMRFNQATPTTLTAGGLLTVRGILVTPNSGGATVTGGSLRPSRVSVGGADFTIFQNSTLGDFTLNTSINNASSSATVSLVKEGPGRLVITANQGFSGNTFINAGTIAISSNAQLGGANGTFGSVVLNGTTLQVTANVTLGNATLSRGIVLNGTGGTLALSTGIVASVPGVISGVGALTISGGSATLGGNNTYSGGTTFTGAKLLATNSSGSATGAGPVSISGTSTLGGNGTITGTTTIASGGHLAPGVNGVGTLTLGNLTLNSSTVLDYEFGPTANDLINLTGNMSFAGGGINLYQAGGTTPFTTNGTYNLFAETGTGTLDPNISTITVLNPSAGITYAVAQSGNLVTLTISGGSTSTAWANVSSGSWGVSGNWTNGIPGTAGDTATFGAAIIAPSTVSLDGDRTIGTLIFNNANAYTVAQGTGGNLTLNNNAGTASISDLNGSHTISVPVILASNTSISTTNAADTLTLSNVVSGTANVSISGPGKLLMVADSTYVGTTTLTGGTLQLGNGGTTGSLAGAIVDNGTLVFNRSDGTVASPRIISNTITGTGGVTFNGPGVKQLTGTNTFTGPINVNFGTVQLGAAGSLGGGAATNLLVLAAGTGLDLNGNSLTVGSLSGSGTIDNTGAANATLTTGSANASPTFSGLIQNSGTGKLALTKTGSGTLTLPNANTFTGGTTISTGSISVLNNGALGNGTINANSFGAIQLGNGVTLANDIVVNAGANEFEGTVASAGLSGNITTTGSTQYRLGTAGGTLTLTGASTVGNSTGNISLLSIITRGNIVFAGNGSLTNLFQAVTIGRSSKTDLLNVTIQDNAVVQGVGVLLGGLNATADDVTTTVSLTGNAVLSAGTGAFDLNNSNTSTSQVFLNVGGNSTVKGSSFIVTGQIALATQVNFDGGTIVATGGDTATPFFPASATIGTNTYVPVVNVMPGGLKVNDGGFAITIAAALLHGGGNPDGGLTKLGAGTVTLTGANTYSGNTSVTSGNLYVNNTTGSGTGTGSVLLNGGLLGGNGSISGPVAAGTGPHTINAGASALAVGTLHLGGNLSTNANTTLSFDLTTPTGTNDLIAVAGAVDISAGGNLAISSNTTGAPSLGYYKVMSYGTLTGSTSGIILPAIVNNVSYTLDANQDPGFIDIHRGFIGDATDDGKVDLNDLNTVLNNLGTTTSSWLRGNFDGAATIDLNDLNDVLNNLGITIPSGSNSVAFAEALLAAAPASTPEPTSLGILALGAGALLARRRKA